ncbi:unnamed protein product, partial [Ectocarpus fasciculatus]
MDESPVALEDLVNVEAFRSAPPEAGTTATAEQRAVAARLVEQLSTIGFAHISGHGLDNELQRRAFRLSEQFFKQPLETKERAISKDKARRGYSPYATENFSSLNGECKPNDLVEKFRIGPDISGLDTNEDPYYSCKEGRINFFPNTWGGTPVGMEETLNCYYRQMEQLTSCILSILEVGLNLPTGVFTSHLRRHTSILGVNYFPVTDIANATRVAEHTDVSLLTILAHEPDGDGLEICSRGGVWREIKPIENALIINVGDCLQYWTNGVLISTKHRVSTVRERNFSPARYSVAYFASPDHDTKLELPCNRSVYGNSSISSSEN